MPTWAHRLPAGGKLAALLAGTAAVLVSGLPGVLAGVAAVAALYASGGREIVRRGLRLLRGLAPVAGLVAAFHLWQGAAEDAARLGLQLVATVGLAGFVSLTTPVSDLTALADRAMARAGVGEVPRRRVALAVALTLRFIPVLGEKGARLAEAWRARSPRRLSPRILLPLALLALDDAEAVAEALRARGGV